MADISLLSAGCCSSCGCDDGGCGCKRGKRGKRGHAGPPGFGLLKFAGFAAVAQNNGLVRSFLADVGVGLGSSTTLNTPPSYPVAIARSLRNLAVNVLGLIVPLGGSILVELFSNGVPVPVFSLVYGSGETGVKTVLAGPVPYAIGATFDLRVTTAGLGSLEVTGVDLSATVGVE